MNETAQAAQPTPPFFDLAPKDWPAEIPYAERTVADCIHFKIDQLARQQHDLQMKLTTLPTAVLRSKAEEIYGIAVIL